MNPEKFSPSNNLQKRFEEKLAGGGEGEGRIELFDDEEEKKKKKLLEDMEHTREKKEAAFDFVNERINQEITEILKERGVEVLDTEGYAKVRHEAVERAIEKMKQESPEFGVVVDEAEKIVEEESNKLTATLKKSGASEEVIDDSRRGFLKMLGLGAVVATAGMAFPQNAEARSRHIGYQEKLFNEIQSNNQYIEKLLSITDDDLKSINKWQEDNHFKAGAATGAVAGIFTAIKTRSLLAGAAVGIPGVLFGSVIGGSMNRPQSSSVEEVGMELGHIGVDGKLVDRALILEEIKRTREKNQKLIQALKDSLPQSK